VHEAELAGWITDVTRRPVRAVQRVAYGASRATYLVEMEEGGGLVARVDTGDGPMAGTELSLVREAAVYRALAGTGVRIPRLHAVAPDGTVLLTDRAHGTHEVDALSPAERQVVYDDYLDAIADLHNLDATALDLPGHRRPTDGPSHAHQELDLWAGILDARTRRPWPLARYTLAVLRELAPAAVDRTVLCHGDVGPGNFLHDGARVTALLDWEFAHLGDPMDDLGWWVFRGHDMRGGCGDLGAQMARWSSRTGLPVDLGRVAYYRVMVMLRWLISVVAALERGGTGMDRSVYYGLVPVLSVRLPRALAGLLGVELPPRPDGPDDPPGPATDVIDAIGRDIEDIIAPAVQHPEARRRIDASTFYLSHLAAMDRHGATLAHAELEDLSAILGRRPPSVDEGRRALEQLAGEGGARPDLLDFFWRDGARQVAAWPLVAARAFTDPTALDAV
jgi:aminoglycoside phosphotransferase (APT) family kinase protein